MPVRCPRCCYFGDDPSALRFQRAARALRAIRAEFMPKRPQDAKLRAGMLMRRVYERCDPYGVLLVLRWLKGRAPRLSDWQRVALLEMLAHDPPEFLEFTLTREDLEEAGKGGRPGIDDDAALDPPGSPGINNRAA